MNRKAGGRFVAESAGSRPAAEVNPYAIEVLERHGYSWTGGSPWNVDAVLDRDWDFVITVCDQAREVCPIFPGQPVVAHWGMPDPAAVEGAEGERRRAFDDALLTISRRLDLLLALPIDKLSKLALAQRIGEIGSSGAARGVSSWAERRDHEPGYVPFAPLRVTPQPSACRAGPTRPAHVPLLPVCPAARLPR